MLDSLVRVSRRVGWVTDLLHAARGLWTTGAPLLHDRRRAVRTPEVSPFAGTEARRRGTSPAGPSTSPATGRGDLHHGGKYARRRRLGVRARPRLPGSPQRNPHPADLSRRAESPRFDLRGPTRLALNGFTYS